MRRKRGKMGGWRLIKGVMEGKRRDRVLGRRGLWMLTISIPYCSNRYKRSESLSLRRIWRVMERMGIRKTVKRHQLESQ